MKYKEEGKGNRQISVSAVMPHYEWPKTAYFYILAFPSTFVTQSQVTMNVHAAAPFKKKRVHPSSYHHLFFIHEQIFPRFHQYLVYLLYPLFSQFYCLLKFPRCRPSSRHRHFQYHRPRRLRYARPKTSPSELNQLARYPFSKERKACDPAHPQVRTSRQDPEQVLGFALHNLCRKQLQTFKIRSMCSDGLKYSVSRPAPDAEFAQLRAISNNSSADRVLADLLKRDVEVRDLRTMAEQGGERRVIGGIGTVVIRLP